jgi:hypothetical protein
MLSVKKMSNTNPNAILSTFLITLQLNIYIELLSRGSKVKHNFCNLV